MGSPVWNGTEFSAQLRGQQEALVTEVVAMAVLAMARGEPLEGYE